MENNKIFGLPFSMWSPARKSALRPALIPAFEVRLAVFVLPLAPFFRKS